MTLYLKGLEKYERSKLKLFNSLDKSRTFNFDLSYFEVSLGTGSYSIYLIGKLLDIVKMIQEGLVVAALSKSIRTS